MRFWIRYKYFEAKIPRFQYRFRYWNGYRNQSISNGCQYQILCNSFLAPANIKLQSKLNPVWSRYVPISDLVSAPNWFGKKQFFCGQNTNLRFVIGHQIGSVSVYQSDYSVYRKSAYRFITTYKQTFILVGPLPLDSVEALIATIEPYFCKLLSLHANF